MVASAAAQAAGLPPKVVVCRKAVEQEPKTILFSRDGGANRHHAAARGFRQTQNIRLHIFVLTGKHLAGTPHAGWFVPSSRIISAPKSSQSYVPSVRHLVAAGSRRSP